MKDLFRAADDLFQASLNMVNKLNEVGFEKLRPQTRNVLIPLTHAMHDYEKSRFHRRKIIVEFEAPMPAKQITRRELSAKKGKTRKIMASLRVSDDKEKCGN